MIFVRKTLQGLDGEYITHAQMNVKENPFTIKATKYGIQIMNESPQLESMDDLNAFAKGVSNAWKDHEMLKKQSAKNLLMHNSMMP